MDYFADAKVLNAAELAELIELHHGNALVDNLVFLELRVKDAKKSTIFPCYIMAWKEDENGRPDAKTGRKPLMFRCTVIQYKNCEYETLPVLIHEEEFEVRKRVWDKPPVESLWKYLPFVDGIMQ